MSPNRKLIAFGLIIGCSLSALVGCSEQSSSSPSSSPSPEITAEWWQWAKAAPAGSCPLRYFSGNDCGVGQTGPVWFLVGGYGSSKIQRTCTFPAGKSLFFPIINMLHYQRRDGPEYTCEQAKQDAALNNNSALERFAELDEVAIEVHAEHRIRSEDCFDVFAKLTPEAGAYLAYPSATDGYWLMLEPLSIGTHTLKFGDRYNQQSRRYGKMVQDIEYQLIVE